jgi:hypothetical protein
VYWDFRLRSAPTPISPAQRRDSVRYVERVDFVIDSMTKAGGNAAALARTKTQMLAGNAGRGFGFGRRGATGEFEERPGESPLPRAAGQGRGAAADTGAAARRGAGRAGGRGAAAAAEPQLDQTQMRELSQLVRIPGSSYPSFGRGGGGRGGANMAGTGDYLVTMTVGNHVERQTVHVQRAPGLDDDSNGGFFSDEGNDDGNP